jgi:hypothetical protein
VRIMLQCEQLWLCSKQCQRRHIALVHCSHCNMTIDIHFTCVSYPATATTGMRRGYYSDRGLQCGV